MIKADHARQISERNQLTDTLEVISKHIKSAASDGRVQVKHAIPNDISARILKDVMVKNGYSVSSYPDRNVKNQTWLKIDW